jgi:hypothetical protein
MGLAIKTGKSMLFTILGLALFTACGKLISDDELARTFMAKENWFNAIASAYTAGSVTCSHPDDCKLTGAQEAASHLLREAHVEVIYVKRNSGGDDGVWLPVETTGILSISSSTRGYAYLDRAPARTVTDTFSILENGTYCKQLKGNWYLFVGN